MATAQAKCLNAPQHPYYSLVGWRAGRVLLLAVANVDCSVSTALVSVDPSGGSERTEDSLPGGVFVTVARTDGRSVAASFFGTDNIDRLLVIDAAGGHGIITPPTDAGVDPLPLTGGGYLLAGSRTLIRVTSDGSGMTSEALPSGYDTVAPTSDPERFVLA